MFFVSPTYRVRQGGVVNNTEDNIRFITPAHETQERNCGRLFVLLRCFCILGRFEKE